MVTVLNHKHCSNDDWDVDISRANYGNDHMLNTDPGNAGWLGNPFKTHDAGGDHTRQEAVEAFRDAFLEKLRENTEFKEAVDALPQTTALACYCKPKACHGDVIQNYLNGNLPVTPD